MRPTLYIVRDRGTRLHYLTGERPRRLEGGVEFTGVQAILAENWGAESVEALDSWPLLRSLPSGDVEYFEVPDTWVIGRVARQVLVEHTAGGAHA